MTLMKIESAQSSYDAVMSHWLGCIFAIGVADSTYGAALLANQR